MQEATLIHNEYDELLTHFLKKGILPARDTGVGYWGITPTRDLFEFFNRINIGEHKSIIDIGSGDGRVVLLASLFGLKAHGIEYDKWLINVSNYMMKKLALPHFKNVKIVKDDFHNYNLSEYDIIYCSPDKPFHRGLENKLLRELNGKLIVHGWEFLPTKLRKVDEHIINGEKFSIFANS